LESLGFMFGFLFSILVIIADRVHELLQGQVYPCRM
jgi:hypothetical protein